MQNIKMIVTDLDRTLLHTDKSISYYTVSILEKCSNKGIKVVFATARSTQVVSRIVELFNPDILIGYGGGLITTANGKVILLAISSFHCITTSLAPAIYACLDILLAHSTGADITSSCPI